MSFVSAEPIFKVPMLEAPAKVLSIEDLKLREVWTEPEFPEEWLSDPATCIYWCALFHVQLFVRCLVGGIVQLSVSSQ